MGSFYSSCSVSNMTLSHQNTSILLLTPAYSTDYSEHLSMVVGDGCQTFFSPFGFPIHGKYDDYGHLHCIVRDKNVEMLEEFFGVDIDDILQNIGDSRSIPDGIKHKELYQKLGMTYFRTEVLEYLERGWESIDVVNPKEYSTGSVMKKMFDLLVSREKGEYRYDFELSCYIRSNGRNMFSTLPITMDFKDEMLKQYSMLNALSYCLRKILTPSSYGSQQTNWCELYNFNDFVSDLLVDDIKESTQDDEASDEEKEILNRHLSVKRDRKINMIVDDFG